MNKLLTSDRSLNILVPVISAILGLIVGAIVMILGGYDPVQGYQALINGIFGTPRAFGEVIRGMTPLLLAGLSVAFAGRTGLFNIGVEGQLLVGWLAAVAVGVLLDLPSGIHLIVAILAAAAAGGVWGFIPGILKAKFKVNEVIVTIMLNYTALYVTAVLVKTDALYAGNERTYAIKNSASLASEFLRNISGQSRLHWGIIIALLAAIIMWVILDRTTLGYELKAAGYNQNAAQYAGMNVTRNIVLSMSIAGAFAGIGGAMEGLGTFQGMTAMTSFTGVGFNGIAVALLGANNPFGIIASSFLFGGLQTAAPQMNFNANVPSELVNVIIAAIIFFVASGYFIRYGLKRLTKEGK